MTSFGRRKTKSNCLANLPRTISQTSFLFRQSQHKRKIRDKNKRYCRQNKCSDLTCTKKYALTEGPKRGGGGNVGHSLSPPSHFMFATGLKRQIHLTSVLTHWWPTCDIATSSAWDTVFLLEQTLCATGTFAVFTAWREPAKLTRVQLCKLVSGQNVCNFSCHQQLTFS